LAAEGVDLAFLPPDDEMWPAAPDVRLTVGSLAERVAGRGRPGALRWGGPGGGQPPPPGRAVPGLLRPEGRPAARRGPAHGRRPRLPERDRRLPDGTGAGRAGGVLTQRLPVAPAAPAGGRPRQGAVRA